MTRQPAASPGSRLEHRVIGSESSRNTALLYFLPEIVGLVSFSVLPHRSEARDARTENTVVANSAPRCGRDERTAVTGGQRVAVVGDSDLVCKAIKLALRNRLKLNTIDPDGRGSLLSRGDKMAEWDLIIVAITSENGEPIAELAQSSLLEWIGRVPRLIISDRPFESSFEFQISHLRFPFDPDQLCDRVLSLLETSPVAAQSDLL